MKLDDIQVYTILPAEQQCTKQHDNDSLKMFQCHSHTLICSIIHNNRIDELITAAHERCLVSLSERGIAEGLTDHNIKVKTAMAAIGNIKKHQIS